MTKSTYGDLVHSENSHAVLIESSRLAALTAKHGLRLHHIVWERECGSTNDALAAAVAAGEQLPDFTVYGTDYQSAGHGRLGRSWTVPPGKAVTFSVLLTPQAPVDMLGWIPLIAGEAVRVAAAEAGVEAVIKWPNDVLSQDGKKLCGILARLLPGTPRRVVLGIGINAYLEIADLPVDTATSLSLAGGDIERHHLIAAVLGRLQVGLRELAELGSRFPGSEYARAITEHMVTLGAQVKVSLPGGATMTGRATGLDTSGDLIIDGIHHISAGDVEHVRPAQ